MGTVALLSVAVARPHVGTAQHEMQAALRQRSRLSDLCPGTPPAETRRTAVPVDDRGDPQVLEEQIAHVAADRAVRRLLPIALRANALMTEATEFEGLGEAWTEAALSEHGDRALRLARRLDSSDATPGTDRRPVRRAIRALRLAWGTTFPLRRHRAAPAGRVVDLFSELFAATRRLDQPASCRAVAEVLGEADRLIRAGS